MTIKAFKQGFLKSIKLLLLLVIVTGCTAGTRTPISEADIQDAAPYGIKGVRAWGDVLGDQQVDTVLRRQVSLIKQTHADAIALGEPIH